MKGLRQYLFTFLLLLSFATFLVISNSLEALATPTGLNISYNVTDTIEPSEAASLTTEGGSFTTMILNGTFQTER